MAAWHALMGAHEGCYDYFHGASHDLVKYQMWAWMAHARRKARCRFGGRSVRAIYLRARCPLCNNSGRLDIPSRHPAGIRQADRATVRAMRPTASEVRPDHAEQARATAIAAVQRINTLGRSMDGSLWVLAGTLTRIRAGNLTAPESFETWCRRHVTDQDGVPWSERRIRGLVERRRKVEEYPDLASLVEKCLRDGTDEMTFSLAFHTATETDRKGLVKAEAKRLLAGIASPGIEPTDAEERLAEQRARRNVMPEVLKIASRGTDALRSQQRSPVIYMPDELWERWHDETLPTALRIEAPDVELESLGPTKRIEAVMVFVADVRDALEAAQSGDAGPLTALVEAWAKPAR